jgi:hypothetical protein
MEFDQNGNLAFTREDLLKDLKLLESFYHVLGQEFMIDWILKKTKPIIITPKALEEIASGSAKKLHGINI